MTQNAPLGDVADFFSGYAWKAKSFTDEVRGMPIIRIQNVGSDASTDFKYWPEAYEDRFVIRKGDLLLTLSGSFRTAIWKGPEALLNQRIVCVTPRRQIDKSWLYYALENAMGRIAGMGRHALVSNVALSDLKQLNVTVPPLDKQKRIAAILDQADALRRLRQRAIDKFGELKASIFHQMFSTCTNFQPLGSLIKVKSGNGLTAKQMRGGDVPVYGGNGINGWHDESFVDPQTVIIGRVGVYCGAVHVTEKKAWVTDNALIVKKLVDIETDYLSEALKAANLNQYAGRSAQPLVSGSRIYPVEIPLPPIEDQRRFSSRIRAIAGPTASLQKSLDVIEALFGSLQHQAFQEEL